MTTIEAIVSRYDPRGNYGAEWVRKNCGTPERQAFLFAVYELQTHSDSKEHLIELLAFKGLPLGDPHIARAVLDFLTSEEECFPLIPLAVAAGIDRDQLFSGFSYRYTPLSYIARSGNIEAAAALLALGADIDGKNLDPSCSPTPLAAAALSGYRDMVSFLLERGADPNHGSPLSYAVRGSDPNVVHLLTAYGADSNRINANILARASSLEVFVAFLDNTCYSPSKPTDEDNCLLHHVAARHAARPTAVTLGMLQELLKRGASPEQAREHAHCLPPL